eukprot:5004085-Pleurochrysis_carterae.AAC.1
MRARVWACGRMCVQERAFSMCVRACARVRVHTCACVRARVLRVSHIVEDGLFEIDASHVGDGEVGVAQISEGEVGAAQLGRCDRREEDHRLFGLQLFRAEGNCEGLWGIVKASGRLWAFAGVCGAGLGGSWRVILECFVKDV